MAGDITNNLTFDVNNIDREFISLAHMDDFQKKENVISITCGNCKVKIIFYSHDIVRILMDPKGKFEDPAEEKIVVKEDFVIPDIRLNDEGSYYRLQSSKCVIRAYKSPLRFAMYDFRDTNPVWEEEKPLEYCEKSTKQTLKSQKDEYFYGGGVQNGYFCHKNKKVYIENLITHWNDGAVSNPAPFYMSTAGYGAFRNTFKPGCYEFTENPVISHEEKRFDCFYFYGPSLRQIINSYTELTGRPSLIPRWGFGLGDADCYNTSSTTYSGTHDKPNKGKTFEALKIAKAYRDNDIPGSWILPNDGYGCGYTDLESVIKEAREKYGFRVGLWTENGVEKIAQEVGTLGSRLCKLDVAWVGPGYEFALNAAKTAFEGIENNTVNIDKNGTYSERGYVWSVCGWAGTQRYSVLWSGDQSGNWEYIRFHIPTYIGAGLSGMPYIGSDVDGIFGGSAKTQTRDIQWKAFTPVLINMSGWAESDKQPWVWGEPYTSINRKYLKLRQRLTPYIYSYASEAYETGAPIVRAMVWEFPKDSFARTKKTQYQFMCGKWFLVAPVYEDREVRDEIYLPQGKWFDYWSGRQYQGGRVINNYNAPLDTLPLFTKAGAIIPMYPEALYDGQIQTDDQNPLTIEVFPSGRTSFELYEDDGHTTLHRQGYYSKTLITSEESDGKAKITIRETKGSYNEMPFARRYEFIIHTAIDPGKVTFSCGEAYGEFTRSDSREGWENTRCCSWYYDKAEKNGLLYIKTKSIPLHSGFNLVLDRFSSEAHEEIPEGSELPGVPDGLKIIDAQDTSLRLDWDIQDNSDYFEIMADGIIYSNLKGTFFHKDLDFVSEHKYRIRAVNITGYSPWSEEISGWTLEDKMKDSIPVDELSAYSTSCLGEKYSASKAVDGERGTQWISNYKSEELPQMITVDIAKAYESGKIVYYPREQSGRAVITKYDFYISEDGRRFRKIINEGTWEDDGEPKTIEFEPSRVKSIRLTALECSTPEFPGASASQISIFKVPGSRGQIVCDFTGDGMVDMSDLNFALQYYGSREGDNDWAYVSKTDIDRDGIIGIYDVAYTASCIHPSSKPGYVNKAAGVINIRPEITKVKKGQEFKVEVLGGNVADLYAFESVTGLDWSRYELIGFEASKAVDHMISACKEKDGRIYTAYTSTGDMEGISGNGVLAVIKLRAKLDGEVELKQESGIIVGSNLDIVYMADPEVPECEGSIFEFHIPQSRLSAYATSEQEETGDGSAGCIFDRDPYTCWHTPWDKSALLPQSITADLGGVYDISKIKCTLRGQGANGVITSYEVYAEDLNGIEIMVSEGKWQDDGKVKTICFDKPVRAAKIRIKAKEGNGGFASMVRLDIYAVQGADLWERYSGWR